MWDFNTIIGSTSFQAVEGKMVLVNTLSGLQIKAPAFAMFSQAMGLTEMGELALKFAIDYGTITTTLSISTTSVPEPSAYAMIGMGLLVVGAVGRRRKASAPQPTTTHQV